MLQGNLKQMLKIAQMRDFFDFLPINPCRRRLSRPLPGHRVNLGLDTKICHQANTQ
jgi:hypothetical protein